VIRDYLSAPSLVDQGRRRTAGLHKVCDSLLRVQPNTVALEACNALAKPWTSCPRTLREPAEIWNLSDKYEKSKFRKRKFANLTLSHSPNLLERRRVTFIPAEPQPTGRFGTRRAIVCGEPTLSCQSHGRFRRKAQRLDPTPDAWRGEKSPPFFFSPAVFPPDATLAWVGLPYSVLAALGGDRRAPLPESIRTETNSAARGKISPHAISQVYPRRVRALACRSEKAVWKISKVQGGPP
jgi:hypothetical protein